MQLWDFVQPTCGDVPQQAGNLPFETQTRHSVIRDTHSTNDRTKYPNNGRDLRHRCPLKNCGHRHTNPRCTSSSTPGGVYGQDGSGVSGGVKTRCHHQSPRTPPHVQLDYTNPEWSSTTPVRNYPSPATTSSPPTTTTTTITTSRGLVAPPPSTQSTQSCQSAQALASTRFCSPITWDYRKKAVQYIITQLRVEGNQDTRKVHEIRRRISSMENQIFNTATSQEEYVKKLASKLAAILQQLHHDHPPASYLPTSTLPASSRPHPTPLNAS